MFLVSLLVLFMVSIPTGSVEGDYPRDQVVPLESPLESPPTEVLPGESAEEYRWRTDAEEQQAAARAQLEGVIAALDPAAPLDANGQTALQAELRLIAVLLDEAAQSRQLGIEARIESVTEAEARAESVTEAEARAESVTEAAPQGAERPREGAESTSGGGTQTAATIAGVVALLTATAGLVAALAGMFTALATWIKARRQPASTDTSASA